MSVCWQVTKVIVTKHKRGVQKIKKEGKTFASHSYY